MTFEEFKTECKRLIYEANDHTEDGEGICTENIKCVELFQDNYKDYYDDGITPKQANEEQYLRSIDN